MVTNGSTIPLRLRILAAQGGTTPWNLPFDTGMWFTIGRNLSSMARRHLCVSLHPPPDTIEQTVALMRGLLRNGHRRQPRESTTVELVGPIPRPWSALAHVLVRLFCQGTTETQVRLCRMGGCRDTHGVNLLEALLQQPHPTLAATNTRILDLRRAFWPVDEPVSERVTCALQRLQTEMKLDVYL